ncbi:MAG: hypothetical protein M1167_03380, partial [Chloroflexi bacterium]|nr:hypothetical protein [Chloroflexota bacterium]
QAQESDAVPDPTAVPDQPQADSPDNSTATQDDNGVLYTIQDNSTASQRDAAPEVPGAEDANLIATQTSSDSNLPIVAGAIVLATVVGALGLLCWRRKFAKKQN